MLASAEFRIDAASPSLLTVAYSIVLIVQAGLIVASTAIQDKCLYGFISAACRFFVPRLY
ncbi:MAG: hypothetical protein C0485_07975 [Pirellula sp.]|nr:hypothetical protein [Pirellula sp.]